MVRAGAGDGDRALLARPAARGQDGGAEHREAADAEEAPAGERAEEGGGAVGGRGALVLEQSLEEVPRGTHRLGLSPACVAQLAAQVVGAEVHRPHLSLTGYWSGSKPFSGSSNDGTYSSRSRPRVSPSTTAWRDSMGRMLAMVAAALSPRTSAKAPV